MPKTPAQDFLSPEIAGQAAFIALFGDRQWVQKAACRGIQTDLFYPERGEDVSGARQVCAGCVVKAECLQYAIDNAEKVGIWGGLSERQRRRIRHDQYVSAAS